MIYRKFQTIHHPDVAQYTQEEEKIKKCNIRRKALFIGGHILLMLILCAITLVLNQRKIIFDGNRLGYICGIATAIVFSVGCYILNNTLGVLHKQEIPLGLTLSYELMHEMNGQVSEPVRCVKCDTDISSENTRFCPHCGEKIVNSQRATNRMLSLDEEGKICYLVGCEVKERQLPLDKFAVKRMTNIKEPALNFMEMTIHYPYIDPLDQMYLGVNDVSPARG